MGPHEADGHARGGAGMVLRPRLRLWRGHQDQGEISAALSQDRLQEPIRCVRRPAPSTCFGVDACWPLRTFPRLELSFGKVTSKLSALGCRRELLASEGRDDAGRLRPTTSLQGRWRRHRCGGVVAAAEREGHARRRAAVPLRSGGLCTPGARAQLLDAEEPLPAAGHAEQRIGNPRRVWL